MANVTLKIPDGVLRQTKARLKKRGQDLEDFVVGAMLSLPQKAEFEMTQELERQLLEGLDSEKILADDAFWKDQINQFRNQMKTKKKAKSR